MPLKVYGYEELNAMTGEELIKAYNRIAERVNKRITRAGGVKKTGMKRMPVLKTTTAKARFLREFKQNASAKVKQVAQADESTANAYVWRHNRNVRGEFKRDLKRTIRQSFAGHSLSTGYKGTWVNKLTPEELDDIIDRMAKINEMYDKTPGGQRNTFWYIYRKSHIIGKENKPITSKADFMKALNTVEQVAIYEKANFDQMTPTERARQIALKVSSGYDLFGGGFNV